MSGDTILTLETPMIHFAAITILPTPTTAQIVPHPKALIAKRVGPSCPCGKLAVKASGLLFLVIPSEIPKAPNADASPIPIAKKRPSEEDII